MRLRRMRNIPHGGFPAAFQIPHQRLQSPGIPFPYRPLLQGPNPHRLRALLGTPQVTNKHTKKKNQTKLTLPTYTQTQFVGTRIQKRVPGAPEAVPGLRDGLAGPHEELLRAGSAAEPRSDGSGFRTRRKDASEQAEAGDKVEAEKGEWRTPFIKFVFRAR